MGTRARYLDALSSLYQTGNKDGSAPSFPFLGQRYPWVCDQRGLLSSRQLEENVADFLGPWKAA